MDFHVRLNELLAQDARYPLPAYEFVMEGLHYTQKRFKRQGHVSGSELAKGLKDFALERFGPMALTVLNHWGIESTDDFGNIVYNLIKVGLMFKTDEDKLSDFSRVYDFPAAFREDYRRILTEALGHESVSDDTQPKDH